MADSDLDYAKVTGRFALTVADGVDADDNPDIVWCTSGTVLIEPLVTYTKVAGGTPVPFTAGHSVIEAIINASGYLEWRGKPSVFVVDLTSDKVNPQIGPGKATHRITFQNVVADDTPVRFESVTVRLTKDGANGDGVNDLTIVSPVATAPSQPIYRGEKGTSIQALEVDGSDLLVTLDDGTVQNAGELPAGPGGSNAGVAGYIGAEGPTKEALSASFALLTANPLNAVQAGYLNPNAGVLVDQSAGMRAFIAAVAAQNNGRGGSGYVPASHVGAYGMGNAHSMKFPTASVVDIYGDAGAGYPYQSGTVFQWTADITAAPDTLYGFILGESNYLHRIRDISGIGPRNHPGGGGCRPASLGFLNVLSSAVVRDCGDQGGFGTTFGIGGPGKYADHISLEGKLVSGSGYALHFMPGSISGGDFRLRGPFVFNNLLACIAIAGSNGGFGGSSAIGGGLYAPVAILGYDDGSSNGANFVDTVSFMDCNFESNTHAAILDLTYSRFIKNVDFNSCPLNVPALGNGNPPKWAQACPVTAVSGSTITVTDPLGGFVFHKNMTVTGTGIPAGTTVTAVTSGTWPGPSYVLTLSNAPSGSAVGTNATISIPTIATFVAQTVKNNEWRGEMTGRPGYPFIATYYTGGNRVRDGGGSLAKVLGGDHLVIPIPGQTQVAHTPESPPDRWGEGGPQGTLLVTGQASYGFLISQYDVVEMSPGNDLNSRSLRPATGGMPIVGIAMQAAAKFTVGTLDIVARSAAGQAVSVKNKSGSAIPAGLVKVDTANPGGVTAAGSLTDGPAIGYTNAGIAAGTVGSLNAFWAQP